MRSSRIRLGALSAALAIAATLGGCASGGGEDAPDAAPVFPDGKPITFIVPYAAGGSTDIAARILAERLGGELDTSVQVVNREGAAQQVGLTALGSAEPDGYTIGFGVLPTVTANYVLSGEKEAALSSENFTPIGSHFELPVMIVVGADSPYHSLDDIVEAAEDNPNTIRVGVSGRLTTLHLAALEFQKQADVKFNIAILDGDGPALTALLGGHVDVAFLGVATAVQAVTGGDGRALAVTAEQPSEALPDVPTATEEGYDLIWASAAMVLGPAGMPDETVSILTEALKTAEENEDDKAQLADLGFALHYRDPAESADFWQSQLEIMRELVPLAQQ